MTQSRKRQLGQFFTKNEIWLKPSVLEFIRKSKTTIAYDPFAGQGDLLAAAKKLGYKKIAGLDIDKNLKWKFNDSLVSIPKVPNSIIITNPPYLTNYSAKRKKIYREVAKYFESSGLVDLYQLALQKCLAASDFVVAIIPETFINSSFPKERLYSITILEENPFDDTDAPVCVVCFDARQKSLNEIKVYKNSHYIEKLGSLNTLRMNPQKHYNIRFNVRNGKIALRAVDMPDPNKPLEFMLKKDLDYDLKGIKQSSRLITIMDFPEIPNAKIIPFISTCNKLLNQYRRNTFDVTLSPFKGNTSEGIRRRRLDYRTARAIMENAADQIIDNKRAAPQLSLFKLTLHAEKPRAA